MTTLLRDDVVSLDGTWSFAYLARPEDAADTWSTIEVPGCWTMQDHGRPQYTNVRMPFDGPPPTVPDPRAADPVGEFGKLGFRVPTQLISPYATGGRVDSGIYDHTSILKFIETNWGLKPMAQWDPGTRDPGERNIVKAFGKTFTYDPEAGERFLDAPAYEAPAAANVPCAGHDTPVSDLFALVENGWMETYGFRTDFPFADAYRSTLPILR